MRELPVALARLENHCMNFLASAPLFRPTKAGFDLMHTTAVCSHSITQIRNGEKLFHSPTNWFWLWFKTPLFTFLKITNLINGD